MPRRLRRHPPGPPHPGVGAPGGGCIGTICTGTICTICPFGAIIGGCGCPIITGTCPITT